MVKEILINDIKAMDRAVEVMKSQKSIDLDGDIMEMAAYLTAFADLRAHLAHAMEVIAAEKGADE